MIEKVIGKLSGINLSSGLLMTVLPLKHGV